MCSKRPVITTNSKPSRSMTKFSKITDLKKKYEYICMLGNGTFGKVRLYRDKFCKDMKFAIKTIKKEGISSYLRDCIIEEVNILHELDHPNIVKYYETYEDDFYINLIMEYLSGEDLFKVISMKKYNNYSEKDAAEIMTYIFKALSFIHNKKIVHRDIKPENILFGVPGDYQTLKLIDFGLSTHTLSKIGKSVGSPYYMAPEIIDGSYTFKTDIWSVGVILYVLMTGKYPFNANSQEEIFTKIKKIPYDMKSLNSSPCSKEAKDLISKLLVKEESERLSIDDALEHAWFKKWREEGELNRKVNGSEVNAPLLENDIIDSIKRFTNNNSFHKEVLFYIAKISKDEEISKLRQIFMKLDKDNTGTLTFDEILQAFEEIGLKVDKVEFFLFFLNVIKNKNNFFL